MLTISPCWKNATCLRLTKIIPFGDLWSVCCKVSTFLMATWEDLRPRMLQHADSCLYICRLELKGVLKIVASMTTTFAHFSGCCIAEFLRAKRRMCHVFGVAGGSLLLALSSTCCEVNTFFKSTWVCPKPEKMKHDDCCRHPWIGAEGS